MKQELLQAVWPTWLTVVGQVMQYFAMVSGALFVPYLVLQRCKQTTMATGAGATYNYLNQAAPAHAAVTTTSFQQDISVGGTVTEAVSAAPHQGGCNILTPETPTEMGGAGGVASGQFMGIKVALRS